MEITLIHLTDIHFTVKTDLTNKTAMLARAVLCEVKKSDAIYFIISGDIAFSGKENEYKKAKSFLSVLKTLIHGEMPNLKIHYVIVPGNHDCNYVHNTQLRINALKNITYQTLGEDSSVTDLCLTTQDDFWSFYSNFNPIPLDKLYFIIKHEFANINLIFHCVNTSWMSQQNEEVGSIFFPVKKYSNILKEEQSINFCVWHHPYNWFTPNTVENNKAEFEKFTENISSTHFFGHEHRQSYHVNINKNENIEINLLSGEILNEDKKQNKSAFQMLRFNLNDEKGVLINYEWRELFYQSVSTKEIFFHKEYKRTFELNVTFVRELEEFKIPIVIEKKKDLKLSDIYIFPDLEATFKDSNKFENHFSSTTILNSEDSVVIVDGENQIGKTSLVYMYFLKFYEKNIYPIFLSGKDIKEPNIEKTSKRAFRQQYVNGSNFEVYRQLENKRKVLLIDDYQECEFNGETTQIFLNDCIAKFGKVIILFDSSNNVLSTLRLEFKKAVYFTIKPFGYKKRNDIIERYYNLRSDPYTFDEQILLTEIKSTFDNVQNILGDKLMPAYPIYILSIIQALQYKPLKQNETSFGYCYQTLIHYSLHKAGVKGEDMDTFLNFLTELAYKFLIEDTEVISRKSLSDFYYSYSSKFICPSFEIIFEILKRAKIISIDTEECKFFYNYILYYLSAKKIADILNTNDGKEIVSKLFSKLENEKNANILVFITHHSKDISFLEESLLNSMIVLDKNIPITLNKDDPFYNEIKEIAEGLKNDILDANRTPKEEREKLLARSDEVDRKRIQSNFELDDKKEVNEALAPFLHSYRSIEIVGQIIKNRKGSLEIKRLNELVSEIYITGFRTIGYYSELLKSMKDDLRKIINEDISLGDNKIEVEKKIFAYLEMCSLKLCMTIFSKLTFCVGTKELKSIYLQVAKELNTPASKLVTFSINSYYGNVSVAEVKTLAEEFKDNIVALRILRARVRVYVYNKNIGYATKQKLASALSMTIIPINSGIRISK